MHYFWFYLLIDGDQKILDGYFYHHYIRCGASHPKIVSIIT